MNFLYVTLCVNNISSETTCTSCDIYIDTTDINAMLKEVCTD